MKQHRWFASRGAALGLVGTLGILNSCVDIHRPAAWGACEGRLATNRDAPIRVRAHRVRGTVSRNGRPWSAADASLGARLVFESSTDGTAAALALDASDTGAFELALPEGRYRVRVGYEEELAGSLVGRVLIDELEVREDRSLTVDLRAVELDVGVRIDEHIPSESYVLRFDDERGARSRVTHLARRSRTLIPWVVPGRYRVTIEPLQDCRAAIGSVLCQTHVLGSLEVSEDTVVDWDLRSAFATVSVHTSSAARVNESLSAAGLSAVARDLAVIDPALDGEQVASIAHWSPGARLYEGRYNLHWIESRGWTSGISSSPLVTDLAVPREARAVGPLASQTFVLESRIALDHHAISAPLASALGAQLLFVDAQGRELFRRSLTGPLDRQELVPTDAAVRLLFENSSCDEGAPCGAVELRPFGRLDRDTVIERDVRSVHVMPELTLDDGPVSQRELDRVMLLFDGQRQQPARLAYGRRRLDEGLRVLAGRYGLQTDTQGGCEGDSWFCRTGQVLARDLDWSAGGRVRVDLRSARVEGEVRVVLANGEDVTGAEFPTLSWIDEQGDFWPSEPMSGARFGATLPRRAMVGVARFRSCALSAADRHVCFTRRVYGCD